MERVVKQWTGSCSAPNTEGVPSRIPANILGGFESTFDLPTTTSAHIAFKMSSTIQITATLPALPEGWSAEKDFKAVGTLSNEVLSRNMADLTMHRLASCPTFPSAASSLLDHNSWLMPGDAVTSARSLRTRRLRPASRS